MRIIRNEIGSKHNTLRCYFTDVGGVIVKRKRNVIDEPSSNPGWDSLNSLGINILKKDMKSFLTHGIYCKAVYLRYQVSTSSLSNFTWYWNYSIINFSGFSIMWYKESENKETQQLDYQLLTWKITLKSSNLKWRYLQTD